MVLRKLPTSTLADIDSKFSTLLPADEFTQNIFQKRMALRELLTGTSPWRRGAPGARWRTWWIPTTPSCTRCTPLRQGRRYVLQEYGGQ